MDIREDEKVIEFFLEREISPETEIKYIRTLKKYMKHAGDGLKPVELIQEAKHDQRTIIDEDDRRVKKRLQRFKKWLKEQKNLKDNTQRTYLMYIKTFYTTLGIRIPPITIKVKRRPQIKKDALPNTEEVKNAVLTSKEKMQAIILTCASSGLYGGDIRELKLEQFLESFNQQANTMFNGISDIDELIKVSNKKEIVIKWEKGRHKNSIECMTFSSPEATRAIVEYLRTDPPQHRDDFLFRYKGRQIEEDALSMSFTRVNDRLGIEPEDENKRIHPMNLRKRFASIIERLVSLRQGEYMLGHILPPVQGSYYKLPGELEMMEAYLKALPELMILEPMETRVLTEDKLKEVEEREREREEERAREKKEYLERERLRELERQKEREELKTMKARLELLESVADKELEQVKKAKKELPKPKD
jgi:hypothetical protein